MGQPSPQERERMSPFAVVLTAVLSLALSVTLIYFGIRLLVAMVG
ncbi:MAG TPA: hypothetical protein VFC19_36655 [Candidatus Limnocylindrales bacterium]|nr:hypothetical protein [Candidatus Limnocylindrales bacterium]